MPVSAIRIGRNRSFNSQCVSISVHSDVFDIFLFFDRCYRALDVRMAYDLLDEKFFTQINNNSQFAR